jgi:hypothetical protein
MVPYFVNCRVINKRTETVNIKYTRNAKPVQISLIGVSKNRKKIFNSNEKSSWELICCLDNINGIRYFLFLFFFLFCSILAYKSCLE